MRWPAAIVLLLLSAAAAAAQTPPPIIDMHLHALRADANGPPPIAICPGTAYPGHDPAQGWRQRLKEGGYRAFAEVGIQYNGISPSDPEFEPYLAIAEELDLPMGIHIGTGPPGAPYFPPFKNYRARLQRDILYNNAARFLRLNDAAAR